MTTKAKHSGSLIGGQLSLGRGKEKTGRKFFLRKERALVQVISGRPPEEIVLVDADGNKLGRYRIQKVRLSNRQLPYGYKVAKAERSLEANNPVVPSQAKVSGSNEDLLPPVDPARRAKTLEASRSRGAIIADDIMTRADMVTGDELAAEFQMSRQAIDQRFRKGQLLGLSSAKRGRKYPTAQFDRMGNLLPGIPEVLAHFNGDAWRAWRFLAAEHVELRNLTGFSALRNGRVDDVKNLLTAMDHGAFS